jgi:exopolysaccharide production protein ExoZ
VVARITRIWLNDPLLTSIGIREASGAGPASGIANRHERLLGLQVLRGLAALLAVIHHVAVTLALRKYMGLSILGGLFVPLGRAGVDLFFVLSGFIIYYVHHADIGVPTRFRRYATRRLVRIYPTYWAVLLLVVGALFVLPSLGASVDRQPLIILKSALLIPFTDRQPIVGVAWTLSHELLFYGLFGVAILSSRIGTKLFAIWLVCLIVARLLPTLPPPLNFFLHVKNLEFFIGMAVARLLLSDRFQPGWGTLLAGAVGFSAVGVFERGGFDFQLSTPTLLYGLAAGVMTLALAALERRGRLPTVPRPLILLGAASYSIYLIHFTVVVAAIKLAHAAKLTELTGVVVFPAVAILAIAAGLLLYALVERPVLRMATGGHDILPMAAVPTMNPREQHV